MSVRRLFIALPVPAAVTDALLDTQEGIAGARWVDADNFHITLRFVGEVDRHQSADLETALQSVTFPPFQLRVAGMGHFTGKHRPSSVWASIAPSPQLDELQMRVEMACRRAGLPPDTRKFVPHITLARLNSGSGPIGDWLSQHGTLATEPWPADRFALYESDLTVNGAIYYQLSLFQ